MELKFCGGAYEVGASCVLLRISDKNILMDCGMRMSGDAMPNLDAVRQAGGVDLILVSHAHMDHIGTLPVISNEYPAAPIIMTHMTKELLRILLYDSLKIMDMRESEIPVFSEVHVKNMMDRIICYSPEYEVSPFNDSVKITMYGAGHIPGAVCMYITADEGSLFYSGDFSISPQLAVGGAKIPKLRPDIAIFEATYGNRLHSNRELELSALLNKIIEVTQNGHKILVPAFALGRAQEILLYINNAMNKGSCPKLKVYVDGMVNDMCRAFSQSPNYLQERYAKRIYKGQDIFYNDNVTAVPKNMAVRREIVEKAEGALIIASSGMLSGGPSAFYAAQICADENNYIALTGYQDEESPGAKLLALADDTVSKTKILKIGELSIAVNCGIGKFGLSAHGDKSQILGLAHALSSKETFFVHGNGEAVQEIACAFQKEHFSRVHVPLNGDVFSFNMGDKKRRQIVKESLSSLNITDGAYERDLKILWDFVYEKYTEKKGFTVEELGYILTGSTHFDEDAIIALNRQLYESPYFTFNLRHPYIFHAVRPEDVKRKDEVMEVNQALALAAEMFEPFGLYKKGAKFDEKIILLYFDFPAAVKAEISEIIEEYETKTKWKINMNSEVRVAACEALIEALLPEGTSLSKSPSYFRTENCFRIEVNLQPDDYPAIEEEFHNKTGVNLYFNAFDRQQAAVQTAPVPDRAEQNAAFNAIEQAFSNAPDKLYKKGLKNDHTGPFIELTFISPEIGEKYRQVIDGLETKLRWSIRVSKSVNQNDVFKIGDRVLSQHGVAVKKNLSYLQDKQIVKGKLLSGSEGDADAAGKAFKELTGLTLVLE